MRVKIALITIGFIVGSFKDFGSLETGRLKKGSSGFCLARVKSQRALTLDTGETKTALIFSFFSVFLMIF